MTQLGHSLLKRHARNRRGRDFIVGDVHGAFSKLRDTLARLDFDPAGDRLFSVGDLVDRGAESARYAEWLERPWFHPVRGNHEQMAIDFAAGELKRKFYVMNGGQWNASQPASARRRVARDFLGLPLAREIATAAGSVGIVHADVPLSNWNEFTRILASGQVDEAMFMHMLWCRERLSTGLSAEVAGIHAVVVGHTVVPHRTALGNIIHIDTGGWMGDDEEDTEFLILDAATLEPYSLT